MARNTTARKLERLEARLNPSEKRTIARAAEIRGATITEFVVSSAKEAALRTIRENEVLVLNEEARKIFVEALLHPPKPNAKALAAARRWKREIG
jgi:uncharacterized protein (DUF1778 family)